jgi:hypothetical protein
MNAAAFRALALDLPEALESSHMDHPDFRVRGKIFATLGPDATWGMVKLTPEQQRDFVDEAPDAFEPIPGAWGERGATRVRLRPARIPVVRRALALAWRNTAPKSLRDEHDRA